MTFRERKQLSIEIPKIDEKDVIKSFEKLHPNLVKGEYYRFKITNSSYDEYVGMFYKRSVIGDYIFKNIDRYTEQDGKLVLDNNYFNTHVDPRTFELLF